MTLHEVHNSPNGTMTIIVREKADKYDKRRKELHAKWKHNYQKRRDRVTG